jgi:hypothetical protein
MRILPTLALALTVNTNSLLTYDFKTDVNKLANCSLLENLWQRKAEFNNFSNPYHTKLFRALKPWYDKNCSK